MNTELLLRVKAHILEEPRRLNMSEWIQDATGEVRCDFENSGLDSYEDFQTLPEDFQTLPKSLIPACGTVACIAGWTTQLAGEICEDRDVEGRAKDLLDISFSGSQNLFYPFNWSDKSLRDAYYSAGLENPQARAEIVAKVIDQFIARYGSESEVTA